MRRLARLATEVRPSYADGTMTAGESTSGRLDLSFGGQLLTGPFAQLATGLRWMFWGLTLQMVGAMGLIAPFAALLLRMPLPNLVGLLPVTILIWLIGGLIVLWGEQKCLHLELPFGLTHALPGQNWLRAAYFCQLASILIRFARRVLPAAFVVWISIPCQILGFVFLLLFLRRLAEVIARDDLRRLIDTVFLLAAASLVIGAAIPLSHALGVGILSALPRPARLPLLVLPAFLFLSATLAYAILLWRMASAAAGFSSFLATVEEPDTWAAETETADSEPQSEI
jgi:hypothetical protein